MALTSLKFHLSLNVSSLTRSVAFYRVFFGLEPAKLHDDYAKFELAEPPVVFSLVPQPALAGGSLSRIALCLPDAAAVAVARQRLEAAGIPTQGPTSGDPERKFYAADPDLNYWEVYTGEDEAPTAPPVPVRVAAADPVVWEHFVSQPTPERIPHADRTLDEVRLTGTFNSRLDEQTCANLVREAYRVLRPGGKVLVHGRSCPAWRPWWRGCPCRPNRSRRCGPQDSAAHSSSSSARSRGSPSMASSCVK
jgi:catechol 2,3-dioxygenase-like lactoylglutathione lyase family enzyme